MTDNDLTQLPPAGKSEAPQPGQNHAPAETISVSLGDHPSYPPLTTAQVLQPGDECGPYRVLKLIGQGGMAAVYLAERTDEIQRKVALKVLSFWTPKRSDLFQSECRILAGLEHPGIARLYDAGSHLQGQPWMAMEHIVGEPLDQYLKRVRPDLDTRLRLFAELGDALSHAHQQMIIHRDLKPSNILVTETGNPKLLDFGIAATLDPGTGEQEGLTLVNERIMTPQYASPEQVNGKRLSAASDVYSLGLILYEMVTGRRAYQIEGRNIAEVLQVVNHETITKPSEQRKGDKDYHNPFGSRLRGDVDTIILKALAREPKARYVSVEAMVADVRAYLAGLPIQARPTSRLYRLRKFVMRNPWPTVSALVLALLMLGFSFYARYQNQRVMAERDFARQEQRTAEAVTQFMVGLFERVDPNVTKGKDLRASELLESGMLQIDADLDQEPRVKLALLQTMGRVHASLGEYRRAADLFEQARDLVGDDPLAHAEMSKQLLRALIKNGTYAEAHRELGASERWYLARDRVIPSVLVKLRGDTCVELGRFVEAAEAYDQVWNKADLSAEERTELKFAQARLYEMWGFSERGIGLYQEVVAAKKQRYGFLHSEVADSLFALAGATANMGRYSEAEVLFAEAGNILETLYAPDHIRYAQLLQSQAFNYFKLDQYEKAQALFDRAVAIYESLEDPDHPEYAMCLNKYGVLLREQRDHAGSERAYRRALTMFTRSSGENHPNTLTAQYNLALALRDQGRPEDSEAMLADGLGKAGRHLGDHHPLFATYLYSIAVNHHRAGRIPEALEAGERVLAIRRRALGERHPRTISAVGFIARRLEHLGRFPEAVAAARHTVELSKNHDGVKPRFRWRYQRHYALYLAKVGRLDEALAVQAAVDADVRRHGVKGYAEEFANRLNLGDIYQWSHQWKDAIAVYGALLPDVAARRGEKHPQHSKVRRVLAYSLRQDARWQASEAAYLAEIAACETYWGKDAFALAKVRQDYGLMLLQNNRYAEAEQQLAEAMAILRRTGKARGRLNGLRANHALAVLFQNKTGDRDASALSAATAEAERELGSQSMAFANWLFWRVEKLVDHDHYQLAKPYCARMLTIYLAEETVPTFRVILGKALQGVIAASEGDAAGMKLQFDEAQRHLAQNFSQTDHWLAGEVAKYQQRAKRLLAGKKEVL
ncbi:serine/threonine-protein kinase [Acanthopleuribacter pedis]|uniref:Serine/threonine protein kinase n=1 Tax=Acanthopleuribacter pedis TaxID=442870 RepID=A0A8J7Q7Q0_9BACT|nr:serine/threonine-protein kinase [Acanthopleuribacter pedis]MBO1319830.1 serine/threonine protein kinase [Acanthopleuribacter pedis]